MRFYMTSFSAVLLLGLTLSCGSRNKKKSEKDEQVSTQAQQKDAKAPEAVDKATGENSETTTARLPARSAQAGAGRDAAEGQTERSTAERSTAELQLRAALSGAGAAPSLLDALPAGTLFYMTITETARSLAAKKKSSLFRLAEEPEFKKFGEYIQEIQAQIDGGAQKKMMREIEQRIGISLINPEPMPGHVELAIQGVDLFAPVPLPQLVLSLDVTEWSADKLFQFIDGMLEFMVENNPVFPKIVKAQITLRGNTPARAYYVQEYETVKLCLFSKGSRIYGALGENTANLLLANLAAPPARGLSRDATFQKVKRRLGPHADRSLMYVNIKAIKNLALGLAAMQAPAQALQFQQMADSLGLNGIQAYGASTGLDGDGKSYQTRTFLNAPAPRRGVAKLFELKRLDQKALMDLPRDTTWGCVVGLPIQELYRELWTTLPALGVNKAQYDDALVQVQQNVGFHIENDLLPSLGDSIALSVSVDPQRLLPDVTAVLALKDQAKFKDCIARLRASIPRSFTPEEFQRQMRRNPAATVLVGLIDKRFSQTVPLPGGRGQGQGIIRYLPIPNTPLSPSYCITDGRLFVSATLDGLQRNLTSRFAGKSYRDSPVLQGQLAKLPPGAAVVTVLDVKGLFTYACAQLRPRMPGWLAMARPMVPFDLDALYAALPKQQTVEKHLLADASHRIVDEDGISTHTVSMLDGTTRLAFMAGFGGVVGGAIVGRMRQIGAADEAWLEKANRRSSEVYLSAIGRAIGQYDRDLRQGYPKKLSDIYPKQMNNLNVFRSPRSNRPPILTKEKIDTESDYFYISGMRSNDGTDKVIAYEMPLDDAGTNVLFLGDWHVEWWSVQRLERHLRQRGLTMKRGPRYRRVPAGAELLANIFGGGGAVVAVPVPNLIKARKAAGNVKVLEALSAYSKMQAIHQYKFKRYGTLAELKAANYLEAKVADATTKAGAGYQGFYFKEASPWTTTNKKFWYQLIAAPQNPQPGDMMYLINQAAKIWEKEAAAAAPTTRVPDPAVAGWWLAGSERKIRREREKDELAF